MQFKDGMPVNTSEPQDSDAEVEKLLKEAGHLAKLRAVHGSLGVQDTTATERGVIGWLIRNNLARDQVQANLILLSITMISVAVSVWIWWPTSRGGTTGNIDPSLSPQEVQKESIKQIQQAVLKGRSLQSP